MSTTNNLLVEKYMSPFAQTIGRDQTIATAHRMMRENEIRHLPVLEGGKLVGIVSQRDLHFVETLAGVDPTRIRVDEAMSQDVFTVAPETKLEEAVETMIANKFGSAVVMKGGKVLGLFTAIDAQRALLDLLRKSE